MFLVRVVFVVIVAPHAGTDCATLVVDENPVLEEDLAPPPPVSITALKATAISITTTKPITVAFPIPTLSFLGTMSLRVPQD